MGRDWGAAPLTLSPSPHPVASLLGSLSQQSPSLTTTFHLLFAPIPYVFTLQQLREIQDLCWIPRREGPGETQHSCPASCFPWALEKCGCWPQIHSPALGYVIPPMKEEGKVTSHHQEGLWALTPSLHHLRNQHVSPWDQPLEHHPQITVDLSIPA